MLLFFSMNELPTVTVIIPCRNERPYIGKCLDSVLAGDYPHELLEIIVADGMSDDGTREVLQSYHARNAKIRCVDNPERIVPTGLNRAIKLATGEYIVRLDAHTEYAPDYIRQCVAVLQETGAANAGGAWRTKAAGYWQSAIALGFHSPFAAGGARSRDVNFDGAVDTVIYGSWRRQTLLDIGLFDEALVRNQDDELNLRLTRAGGVIWQSARIRSWYQPRPSLRALWRQYAQYGYWKVRVIQKHKLPASWRHIVPGAFVASVLLLTMLSLFSPWARVLWLLAVGSYITANLLASLWTCRRAAHWRFLPIIPLVFGAYQIGYGYGFLRGVVDFVWLRRGASAEFKALTRGQPSKP
jgi:glycosyltransferase involved in cell wall biosynthesis